MTTLFWPDTLTTDTASTGVRTRRVAGLLCAVGYYCSVFIESVTSTVDGDATPAAQLAHIQQNLGTIGAEVLFEFLTPLFLLGMAFTLVGALRRRGVGFGSTGGVLAAVGALAAASGAAVHLVVYTLVSTGAPDQAATAVLAVPLPDALFFALFATPLALLVLAAGAWRAGLTTWLPFTVVAVSVVLDLSMLLPPLVSVITGLAGFLAILWPLVRVGNARRTR